MRASFVPPTLKTAEDLLLDFERTGNPSSFEEIVRRYSGMVYGVCYRITRNAHDAEDATQAVFLKLAIQARTASGVPRVGPWLSQVARTTAMDLRRSRTRRSNREQARAAIDDQQTATPADATETLSMDELKQLLREEVDQLPAGYRTPLILYYFGGLSTEQIAKELKSTAKALGVRLFRGRKMLAGRLKQRGVSAPSGGGNGAGSGAMMKTTLAASILAALADGIWVQPVALSAAAPALSLTQSPFATAIADGVMNVVRACSALSRSARWKLSIVLLLMMSTALAGSSPRFRNLPAVRQVGGWLDRLTDVLDDIGGIKRLLRGMNLVQADPPAALQPPGGNLAPAGGRGAIVVAGADRPLPPPPMRPPIMTQNLYAPSPMPAPVLQRHGGNLLAPQATAAGSFSGPRAGDATSPQPMSATRSLLAMNASGTPGSRVAGGGAVGLAAAKESAARASDGGAPLAASTLPPSPTQLAANPQPAPPTTAATSINPPNPPQTPYQNVAAIGPANLPPMPPTPGAPSTSTPNGGPIAQVPQSGGANLGGALPSMGAAGLNPSPEPDPSDGLFPGGRPSFIDAASGLNPDAGGLVIDTPTAVPEPTGLLAAAGTVGLLFLRRRRRL